MKSINWQAEETKRTTASRSIPRNSKDFSHMQNTRLRWFFMPTLLLATLLTALPTLPLHAAAPIPASHRLPEDTYAYFSIPNAKTSRARFSSSPMGQTFKDKSFDEFWKAIKPQMKEFNDELKKGTGVTVDDLYPIANGELTFAITDSDTQLPAVIAFVDFGKERKIIDQLIARMDKEAKKSGAGIAQKKYNGTTIHVIKPPANNPAAAPPGIPAPGAIPGLPGNINPVTLRIAYFIKDTHFVIATDIDLMEVILDNWDGKAKDAFVHTKVYSYINQRCRTDKRTPAFEWYLNPLKLVEKAVNLAANQLGQGAGVFGMVQMLGFANFKAVGGCCDMMTNKYSEVSKTIVYVEQPTAQLLNIFTGKTTNQAPPAWIPATVSDYKAVNWDIDKAFATIKGLIDAMAPVGSKTDDLIDQMEKDPNGPGLHIKKEIIDNLSGTVYKYLEPTKNGLPNFLVAIGAKKNREKELSKVVKKLITFANAPGKEHKVGGKIIYEIDLSAQAQQGALPGGIPPLPKNAAQLLKFYLVADKGHLFIGNNLTKLKNIVNGKHGKSLANSAKYKKIAAHLPAKTTIQSYGTGDSLILTLLRNFPMAAITLPAITKLPANSALTKYRRPAGSYTAPDKNGIYIESFSLKATK